MYISEEINIKEFTKELIVKNKEYIKNYTYGIYFLINYNDEIVYIGKSKNFYSRIACHIDSNMKFSSYYFIPIPNKYNKCLSLLEKVFILKFKPKYNKRMSEEINCVLSFEKTKEKIIDDIGGDNFYDFCISVESILKRRKIEPIFFNLKNKPFYDYDDINELTYDLNLEIEKFENTFEE